MSSHDEELYSNLQLLTADIEIYLLIQNNDDNKNLYFTHSYKIVQANLDYPDLLGLDEILWIIEGQHNRKYKY